MRKYIQAGILLLGLVLAVSTQVTAQVGIGTDNPTNTLHIKPADANEDPLRVENLNQILQGDSSFLVVDPATGVIRHLPLDSLFNYMSVTIDMDPQNELQNAEEVPLSPLVDVNGDGTNETNVQEAIELLSAQVPKGTYRSIGEARSAGLVDGDSFWADPLGVFGCSGCVVTLHPGMN